MCGRYDLHTSVHELLRLLRAKLGALPDPSFNIAPTRKIAVIRETEPGQREAIGIRWGLVPSWSKGPDSGYSMINARAETVTEKPAFRNAFRARRCLILADGFYEWQRSASGKQPYYVTVTDDRYPFLMAGLWERWRDPQGGVIESCAIITTEANGVVANIHDRMPVILDRDDSERWLAPGAAEDPALVELLQPYPDELTQMWPVSQYVNSASNDDPQCKMPLAQSQPQNGG